MTNQILNYPSTARTWPYRRVVWSLSGLLLFLGLVYVWLVNSTIFQAVGRQHGLDQLNQLQSTIAALEGNYWQLSSQVTLERAHQLGYQDASSETIVSSVALVAQLAPRQP